MAKFKRIYKHSEAAYNWRVIRRAKKQEYETGGITPIHHHILLWVLIVAIIVVLVGK